VSSRISGGSVFVKNIGAVQFESIRRTNKHLMPGIIKDFTCLGSVNFQSQITELCAQSQDFC